jgi:hypothetical protein
MNRPAAPPLDDRERLALFEAMDGLDDRERGLLLEHYFEKVALPELGARRGVSAVTIWKRIDRAREKLKKSLLGAGFTVSASNVSEALEATTAASAPPSLVGEAILGKILAGGLAVSAAKSSIPVVAAVLLLLGLTLGGLTLFKEPKPAPAPARETVKIPTAASANPAAPENLDTSPAGREGESPSLRETLQRYKAWVVRWKAGQTPESLRSGASSHRREARKEFKGTRAMILKEPEILLEFLRDPAHEEVSDTVIGDLLFEIDERTAQQVIVRHAYGEFPGTLMEGLAGLLKSGPAPVKIDVLLFLVSVDDMPESLNGAVADLLTHSDSQVQYWAVCVLSTPGRPLGDAIEDRLMERCVFRGESDTKAFAIQALSKSENPEIRTWMLGGLERNREPDLLPALAEGAVTMALKGGGEILERVATLLTSVLGKNVHEANAERVLVSALRLPAAQATKIFQAVQYKGLAPRLVVAVSAVLDRIARGDSTVKELQSVFTTTLKR